MQRDEHAQRVASRHCVDPIPMSSIGASVVSRDTSRRAILASDVQPIALRYGRADLPIHSPACAASPG
jgi:hypothetical protein